MPSACLTSASASPTNRLTTYPPPQFAGRGGVLRKFPATSMDHTQEPTGTFLRMSPRSEHSKMFASERGVRIRVRDETFPAAFCCDMTALGQTDKT